MSKDIRPDEIPLSAPSSVPFPAEEFEAVEPPTSFLKDVWQAYRNNRMALGGALGVALLVFMAVFAPLLTPYGPFDIDLDVMTLPPSAAHWLGTDQFGRDLLTRILYGSRISLVIGIVPTLLSMAIGTTLGLVGGWYGGKIDYAIMRLADIVLAFPSVLLAMVVMYTLGASLFNLFIALAVVGWAGTSRVVRSQVISLREKEFVEACRAMGVKTPVILFRHILPNCLPSLIVLFTLGIPGAILSEASLSFLGVGAQPPTPSWGLIIVSGKEFLFSAPWIAIAPGVFILLTVLAFNFLGDGLRDAFDPYMKP
ncbi:MAG: ABC transporter permease [Synergistaceae bacterium]|jgi:peptide/nickel transport system permease protein/oligopeptide transport system permease protein|nr:ABC transporter permease [Synergistaceae bacterium]